MKKSYLVNYAKLIIQLGANVQKGQSVVINSSTDIASFTNLVVEQCYKRGAKEVRVEWNNIDTTVLKYKHESVKTLSTLPEWYLKKYESLVETLPCMIHLVSDDPDGMLKIKPEKQTQVSQLIFPYIKEYRDKMDSRYQWVIAGVPSARWAKKVFPKLSKNKAIEALWEAILKTSRAYNDDPIAAWTKHEEGLKSRVEKLNSMKLDRLHYTSSNGTDFTVWLSDQIKWEAGGERTLGSNILFSPNIPSEECFTTPIRGKAEGVVYSTKPLSCRGVVIESFSVKFENGKAVKIESDFGEQYLRDLISIDEGASYLGEVALVPYDSPINLTNILFYNTLYDENASCHLAFGRGFSNLVKNYENMTKEEISKVGVNQSMIHVDFMIGSKDMDIVGYTKDNKEIQIFKDGQWAF